MPDSKLTAAGTQPDPDLSGRTLGDYQLLRRLGRGGMADVYLAEQKSLRRKVAFKVLRRNLAQDEAYVRRFHHEAQAAASLVHANIVQVHEVGFIDGLHFIAQEYVAGQNLQQLLARHGPLEAKDAVQVMRQVAAALHKAGEQKIIHRDVKPENIMLAPTGEVKVADFGLARVLTESKQLDLTQVGITMGTPLYMSPEQVEGRSVDPRSDVYSFGVTCYQMLTGRPPFEGETALAIAVQHLKKQPDRLENLRPNLPEGLCRIVHKMMAKAPEKRYQSAAELMRDLRALKIDGMDDDWHSPSETFSTLPVTESTIAATQHLDTLMKTEAVQRQRSRRAVLVMVAACAAGFFLGAGVAWINRPPPLLQTSVPTTLGVEKQDNARAQYYHAIEENTEEAWQSVWHYFPPTDEPRGLNERYMLLAKLRLAEFYSAENRRQQALATYDQVIDYDIRDPQYRLFALVGQANMYVQQGQMTSAEARLSRIADGMTADEMTDELRGDVFRLLHDSLHEQLTAFLDEATSYSGPRSGIPLSQTLQQSLSSLSHSSRRWTS